jgi:transposase-like protein
LLSGLDPIRWTLDEGKTVAAAARDLGLTESSLRNWVEQARADRTKGKTGLTTAERARSSRGFERKCASCAWSATS